MVFGRASFVSESLFIQTSEMTLSLMGLLGIATDKLHSLHGPTRDNLIAKVSLLPQVLRLGLQIGYLGLIVVLVSQI